MNDVTGELFNFQDTQNSFQGFQTRRTDTLNQQSSLVLATDVINNIVPLTQRRFQNFTDGDRIRSVLTPYEQACSVQYIKISDFSLKRESVLNNFINYEIYADVFGRVDNQHNDFTNEISQTNVLNTQTETSTQQTISSSSAGGSY